MMKSPFPSLLCLTAVLLLPACESVGLRDMEWTPDLLKKEYEPLKDDFISQAPPSTNSSAPLKQVFIKDGTNVSDVVGLTSSMASPIPSDVSANISEEDSSDAIEIFDLDSWGSMSSTSSRAISSPMHSSNRQAPMMKQMAMNDFSSAPTIPYVQEIPTSDPSVTIFSLDGSGVGAGQVGVASSSMMSGGSSGLSGFTNGSVGDGSAMISGSALASGGASNQIFFKHGSSRLGSGDVRKISQMAEQAKFAPVNYITVSGYASRPTQAGSNSTEAHIINLRQALKRSEKVSKELVRQGVPGDKIKTVGWGTAKATGNESQDRRVDIMMGER